MDNKIKEHQFKAGDLRKFADGGVIASNIIMQLGGFSRLQIMLGAYNFVDLKNGLSFKIKNPKANYIKITLNGKDLYDIEIGRIRGTTYKVVHSQEDVYAVDLRKVIEKHTGMYMAFKDGGDIVLEDAYNRDEYTDEETLVFAQAYKLANGGITAMEVLEAREFVGEKDWVKMKPKERLAATRYLIRTGKIGYYAYANGGTTKARPSHKSSYVKKYKVKYLIGYSDEEEGLKYYEEFYYADSKDVAALEVFDHLQRQGYTHIEILSITLMADKGMEIQSDEQLMEKYRKLKGNYVPDWFRDMPTRYKVEIIDEIEDGYEGEKPEGDEFARGGSIESKRERVVDYYINNEDDETLNFEFDIPERALENRDKYYKEIFEKISDQFEDEEIYYKFRELNLDEASEEPEDYAKGGNIENQYSNKTSKQVYELWDYGQKWEFFKDHFLNKGVYSHSEYKNLPSKKYEELDKSAKDALDEHIKGGQYADGGNIEATIKQRLSKSFELPLQMAIYVPSTKDKNVVISKDELAYRVKVVEKYLATLFGGFNSAKVDGGFQSVDKGVINEDAVRVVAFANPEGFEPKFEKLVNKVKEWCRLWSQESIGLEFENDLFYIEQDSKFDEGGEVEKIYGERIITDKNGNQYAIKNWAAQGYIIPFNGSQYWEHFRVPKENWIKIEDINWSKFNISKSDFYNYLDSLNQKASEILNKYRSSFAKGGKVKNPHPDYPDFVSMQYKIGGDIEWGEDLGDGFSVGNDVYITDSKSMHKGKTGFVSGLAGKDLLVTISENGNERSIVVSKKGVQMLDAPMAKGGMTKGGFVTLYDENDKDKGYVIKKDDEYWVGTHWSSNKYNSEKYKTKKSAEENLKTIKYLTINRQDMFANFDDGLTKKDVLEFINITKNINKKYWIKDSTGYSKYLYKGQLRNNDSVEGIFTATKIGADRLNDSYKYKIQVDELYPKELRDIPNLDANQNLKEKPISIANKDWKKYVKDNSSFSVDEETENKIVLATRENGSVGDEQHSPKDIERAKNILKNIKDKYPNTKGRIYTVDEWVMLELEAPKEMAKGGQMDKKPAKFKDKVKAISKSLEGKKVPKRVRKDYGATYNKKESMDAAKRIAGSMAKKERKRYEI